MEFYIGQIFIGGWNFPPRGSTFAEGQLLAISQNTALFSLYGTVFGGDGRTTFGLPDLRGRVPMGSGNGPGLSSRKLGQKSGQEDVQLITTQMPSHNHALTGSVTINVADTNGTTASAKNKALAKLAIQTNDATQTGDHVYAEPAYANGNKLNAGSIDNTLAVANNGGSLAHNNMQPYLVLSFCVALVGIFPSRS